MIERPKIQVNRAGVMARLKQLGLPVLPVAPAQDAVQYPAKNRQGQIMRDRAGKPKPAFTGKNPSFLDSQGIPKLIPHRFYQDRLPFDWESKLWFANPSNGVMTMGGWNGIIWIDIDVKRYSSQNRCDRSVAQWLDRYPLLRDTWLERTHSGGWRLAIQVEELPDFTNFGFRRGQHLGEILGKGRWTVLAPSVGPSGQPYTCLNSVRPVTVRNVAEVGLKPARAFTKAIAFKMIPTIVGVGEVGITDLVTKNVAQILTGLDVSNGVDRSYLLTSMARELYGWSNWCMANGVPLAGAIDELIYQTGAAYGIDEMRVRRILEGVDRFSCQPAMLRAGGEISAWKRIKRLNWNLYRAACPRAIQQAIRENLPTFGVDPRSGGINPI